MSPADPLLDQLLTEARTESWPVQPRQGITKVRYTHDAMIDFLIADPTISQNELAVRFGYTASWVSTLMSSDAFQARMAERTAELVDPTIRATVKERFDGLVRRSLEILAEKLDKPSAQIPDNLVLKALEISSKAAGYGAKVEERSPPINMSIHLDSLGANLVNLFQRKKAESEALPHISETPNASDIG